MATPNSRESLIQYSLRQLGAPVVDINVDWQQCEDRLDDALQYFTERHFDGVEKVFFKYQLTNTDITNRYINTESILSPNEADGPTGKQIVSIVKVMQFGAFSNINMFDIRYQLALTDYFGINRNLSGTNSMGLASYDSTKRYIQLIQDMFQPEKAIEFSKVTNRLYLDMNWAQEATAGNWICILAYAALDPEKYTEIFNDRYLKRYVTALIKRQWGANMSKFDGVALPGGVVMRGGQIYTEAINEIARIEEDVLRSYELPVDFMTG
jgi:hypothetical protein